MSPLPDGTDLLSPGKAVTVTQPERDQALAPHPEAGKLAQQVRFPREPRRRARRWERRRRQLREDWQSGELTRRLLVATPMVATGFTIWAFGGVYGWAYGLAYILSFGAAAVWALQWWRGRLPARWRPIHIPVLLFGILGVAQMLGGLSAVPSSTATALLHLSAAGAVFLVMSQCLSGERDAGWVAASFCGFTAALAILAIMESLTSANGIYWHFTYAYASSAGSFVNRNHFSGCMEMLIPVACVEAYRHRKRDWLTFLAWSSAPALGVAAVVLAASRGGVASLSVEGIAALVVWRYRERGQRRMAAAPEPPAEVGGWLPLPWRWSRSLLEAPGSQARLRSWTMMFSAAALLLLLIWTVGPQRLQRRVVATNVYAPSLEQRMELNQSSLAMFRQRPWVGWGLGTWADVYPEFARFSSAAVYEFAHNDYLQLLAETGLAGSVLVVLFWSFWMWEFLARMREWQQAARAGHEPAWAPLTVAGAIGCLGILAHSWVDFNLHIPANLLQFFILAAFALAPTQLLARRERPS